MNSNLEKQFAQIGADIRVVSAASGRRVSNGARPAVRINIIEAHGKELFEIAIRPEAREFLELSVQEVKRDERHLVLFAREFDQAGKLVGKDHFLCGFDERHLFVASVESVSTVAAAKASLKPTEIAIREIGLNTHKRNRRKTKLFKRQGEWFFIPADVQPDDNFVRKNERLSRGTGSKPHIAQYAYRNGGEVVMVCREYPAGVTSAQYDRLIASRPLLKKAQWREMRRNAAVYVKGTIKHADHATVTLDSWHRVLMNTEKHSEKVAFLD